MRPPPPPQDIHRDLGMVLLQGPRGALFHIGEVPLNASFLKTAIYVVCVPMQDGQRITLETEA